MSIFSNLWSSKKEDPRMTEISVRELADNYDIVEYNSEPGNQFAIVTRGSMSLELGSSSPSPWTSFTRQEYNPLLRGLKGFEAYDKMRKSDGTVRGTLRAIKTPALSGRWFIESASDKKRDKKIADFVWHNLTEMSSTTWIQILIEATLMLDFGYYMFEKVWEFQDYEGERRLFLKKLGPRHPMDVKNWCYDANGGPNSVVMYSPFTNDYNDDVYIDISKLLVVSFDREAGNIEGISVLRSAYKHWYFKEQLYKIDAIQKERHSVGIPVIKLPLGYSDDDKKLAEELGRNIRTNERAHIVMPPNWEIMMLKLEGQPVNVMESIEHHDARIRENILVNFIRDGAREEDLVMFLKASRFIADIIAESFNTYLIKQMVDYNFSDVKKYPKLRVRRIGESADWRTMSFALRNLIGAGVIRPDEPLEENMREEMDLPRLDKETARMIDTPQNPYDYEGDGADMGQQDQNMVNDIHNKDNPNYNRKPKKKKPVGVKGPHVGLPRQTTVGKAKNSYGLPRSNGGVDTSGGK